MRTEQHSTESPPGGNDPASALAPFSGLLGHAVGGRSGLLRFPIRVARKILKRFLSPWFDLQTRFNHTLMRVFTEQTHRADAKLDELAIWVADIESRVMRESQASQELRAELSSCIFGIDAITQFDAAAFACRFAGEVKGFNVGDYIPEKEARHMDRFIHLGLAAAAQAVADSGLPTGDALDPQVAERIGCNIGSGIGGFGDRVCVAVSVVIALADRTPLEKLLARCQATSASSRRAADSSTSAWAGGMSSLRGALRMRSSWAAATASFASAAFRSATA